MENHLEFIIKIYPLHKGVTNELRHLKANDELILHEVFGAIKYKGKGHLSQEEQGLLLLYLFIDSLNLTTK